MTWRASIGTKHVRGTVTVPRVGVLLRWEPRSLMLGVDYPRTGYNYGPTICMRLLMLTVTVWFAKEWWR